MRPGRQCQLIQFHIIETIKSGLILLCASVTIFILADKADARRYFMIERPRIGLELSYEFEEDERKGPVTDRKDITTSFSELLDIRTNGWVYHPALLTYMLEVSPEWEQRKERNEITGDRKTNTFLEGYFTELTFLQKKPYTLKLFAKKQTTTLNSSFAGRSDREASTYGSSLMLKYRVLPTLLNYKHLSVSQTGFYETEEDTDEFMLNMRHNNTLGDTTLNASYTDTSRTTSGIPADTESRRASLINSYDITEDKKLTLRSDLNYSDTSSSFSDSTRHSLHEKLRWRHRKNLTTNYTLLYNSTDFQNSNTKTTGAGFDLTHLLYENLTTVFSAERTLNTFDEGRENKYGGALNFDYKRRIPWGNLNLTMGHRYSIYEREVTENFIQVIDEAVTLTTGTTTLLSHRNIDTNTILVTDITGMTTYLKDIDYRITTADSYIRISRTAGGAIADGQTVNVDYKYLGNPASDYSLFGRYYGIYLRLWSFWDLYYRFNSIRQDIISGIPPERPLDDTIRTAGTELRWKWTKTRLEYENRDTSTIPSERWRVDESLTLRPMRKLFTGLNGYYGENTFTDTDETETVKGIRASLQIAPSRRTRLEIGANRDQISGRLEKLKDTGFSSVFKWVYSRVWNGSITYRFSNEEDGISDETFRNHYMFVKIKRAVF